MPLELEKRGDVMGESRNAKKIRTALEKLGHTNVVVWWEQPWGDLEMQGAMGGFMYASDQRSGEPPKKGLKEGCGEPLGLCFSDTMERIHYEGKWV